MNTHNNTYNFLKALKKLEKKHNLKLVVGLDYNQFDGLILEGEGDYHYHINTKKYKKNTRDSYKQHQIDYKLEFNILEDYLYEADCRRFEQEGKDHVAKVDSMYDVTIDGATARFANPLLHFHSVYSPVDNEDPFPFAKHGVALLEHMAERDRVQKQMLEDFNSHIKQLRMSKLERDYEKHNPNVLMLEALAKANNRKDDIYYIKEEHFNHKPLNPNLTFNVEPSDIAYSKYTLGNFDEAIKTAKYKFTDPEYNENGELNMYFGLVEIDKDNNEDIDNQSK